MRVHETEGKTAWFYGDDFNKTPTALINCECSPDKPQYPKDFAGRDEDPYYCLYCGSELVYRPWFEW